MSELSDVIDGLTGELERYRDMHAETLLEHIAELRRWATRIAALEARCREQDEEIASLNEWYDKHQKRIAELEAALKGACGHLVRFILEGDSRQEQSVDEFLVKWTEFSGVTSNAFTKETAGKSE